jgi:hypothetical protein
VIKGGKTERWLASLKTHELRAFTFDLDANTFFSASFAFVLPHSFGFALTSAMTLKNGPTPTSDDNTE